ncbi:uncharacterized protein LOC135146143 isoform X4 [Zophobas morio]|uniref:uncharacterized protein LOC135146143 isoform X4 n=1 Tax=Zophobas morio TaxID=2755281 RepID=UPI003082E728
MSSEILCNRCGGGSCNKKVFLGFPCPSKGTWKTILSDQIRFNSKIWFKCSNVQVNYRMTFMNEGILNSSNTIKLPAASTEPSPSLSRFSENSLYLPTTLLAESTSLFPKTCATSPLSTRVMKEESRDCNAELIRMDSDICLGKARLCEDKSEYYDIADTLCLPSSLLPPIHPPDSLVDQLTNNSPPTEVVLKTCEAVTPVKSFPATSRTASQKAGRWDDGLLTNDSKGPPLADSAVEIESNSHPYGAYLHDLFFSSENDITQVETSPVTRLLSEPLTPNTTVTGFVTGHGRAIKVSTEAQGASKRLLDEVFLTEAREDQKRQVACNLKASKRPISEQPCGHEVRRPALAEGSGSDPKISIGFTSAAGKRITVNANSLSVATKLRDQCDLQSRSLLAERAHFPDYRENKSCKGLQKDGNYHKGDVSEHQLKQFKSKCLDEACAHPVEEDLPPLLSSPNSSARTTSPSVFPCRAIRFPGLSRRRSVTPFLTAGPNDYNPYKSHACADAALSDACNTMPTTKASVFHLPSGTQPRRVFESKFMALSPSREALNVSLRRTSSCAAWHFVFKIFPRSELERGAVYFKDNFAIEINIATRTIGLCELQRAFYRFPGVNKKFVSPSWVKNHYHWIVSKLYNQDRLFSRGYQMRWLTPQNILSQLLYRYEREVNCCNRSAVRSILEKDQSAARCMILFVSDIFETPDALWLELCDGWYAVSARLDPLLAEKARRGSIYIGQKLRLAGARIGGNLPSTPLELESRTDAYLMVDYNCTRRAKCLSKLGFCRRGLFVPLPLAGFSMKGGWIGCVIAVIQRIYPLLYVTPSRVASHPPLIGEQRASQRQSSGFWQEGKTAKTFFIRIKVVDCSTTSAPTGTAYIWIYAPSMELREALKEGARVRLCGLLPRRTSSPPGALCLNTTYKTLYGLLPPPDPSWVNKWAPPRTLATHFQLLSMKRDVEVDVLCCVIKVLRPCGLSKRPGRDFHQDVFVTGDGLGLMLVRYYGGLAGINHHRVCKEGAFLLFENLVYKCVEPYTKIPVCEANGFTVCTTTIKATYQPALSALKEKMQVVQRSQGSAFALDTLFYGVMIFLQCTHGGPVAYHYPPPRLMPSSLAYLCLRAVSPSTSRTVDVLLDYFESGSKKTAESASEHSASTEDCLATITSHYSFPGRLNVCDVIYQQNKILLIPDFLVSSDQTKENCLIHFATEKQIRYYQNQRPEGAVTGIKLLGVCSFGSRNFFIQLGSVEVNKLFNLLTSSTIFSSGLLQLEMNTFLKRTCNFEKRPLADFLLSIRLIRESGYVANSQEVCPECEDSNKRYAIKPSEWLRFVSLLIHLLTELRWKVSSEGTQVLFELCTAYNM